MKHIIGGMDATKELIFKAFMCIRCTFKAFGVLWHFKVVQMNRGSFKKKINLFRGTNYRAPWRDFMGVSTMTPLKSEGLVVGSQNGKPILISYNCKW
jgi:hypothetical protein